MQANIEDALCSGLGEDGTDRWLVDFHAGRRSVLEQCYRELYPTVQRAVGRVLTGADQETVIHEVFYRLISREDLRRSFRGGSLKAWIATVAYHQALEYVRRQQREQGALAQVRDLGVVALRDLPDRLAGTGLDLDAVEGEPDAVLHTSFLPGLPGRRRGNPYSFPALSSA